LPINERQKSPDPWATKFIFLFSLLALFFSLLLPNRTGVHQGSHPETGAHKHAKKEEQEDWLPADTR
jgi:hypothetical protein